MSARLLEFSLDYLASRSSLTVTAGLMLATTSGMAYAVGACDRSTGQVFEGCKFSADGDYSTKLGVCDNFKAQADRQSCVSRARNDLDDAKKLCGEQRSAGNDVCSTLGQAPYDPVIKPASFTTRVDNRLMPMKPGDVRVYENGDATVTVTGTDDTIKLMGVDCVVVRDVNKINGVVEEDTLDYYAQDREGNVWYFGEDTISYDKGIASTEGSWRAGVDGAKPGIVMYADPKLGDTYREEFDLANAEDLARNVAFDQKVEVPFGTFDKTFQTREFTPIEPQVSENKFYAARVGQVLAVDRVTGEREELVKFTQR